MDLSNLLDVLEKLPDCRLVPPAGLPKVPSNVILPADLDEFYRKAGGAFLFPESDYPIEIVGPTNFVRSNPVIRGADGEGDMSYNWFIIGQNPPQYISIDLHPDRLGRCYDSFWDIHALVGDCPVIATSFAQLVEKLIDARGAHLYWHRKDFKYLGDAYDDATS